MAAGWGELPPSAQWHGFVGVLEPSVAGPIFATWFVAEVGNGARATAVRSVVVEAVEPDSVRDEKR